MFKNLILIILLTACSSKPRPETPPEVVAPITPKEFSRGEVILSNVILTKIFDQEMAPLECVPNTEEASLLLRTLRPRMEVVEEDVSSIIEGPDKINDFISTCDQNCTCGYLDEMLREHLVVLSKKQRQSLDRKNTEAKLARCLNFAQSTFCQSELYKTLNEEKSDFSYE